MSEEIFVLAEAERKVRGGEPEANWVSLKVSELSNGFRSIASSISKIIQDSEDGTAALKVSKVEVTVGLMASGKVGIFGTGAEGRADAGIKLTFERQK